MKKYVLVLISTLFQLAHPLLITAQSSQTVTNGGIVAPISLNGCPTSWTNDIPAIGLPATGTGDIASFRAINTGNSPITATITANPASFAFMQYSSVGIMPDVINTLTGTVAYSLPLTIIGKASAVSPDQQWVYMQSLNGIVRINALTGAITTFSTPTVPIVYDFVLNASGSLLYATSAGTNQVYVLETSAMTSKAIINLGPPGPGSIDVMSLSPDGSTLYAPDIKNGNLYVISTATNTVVNTIPVNPPNDNSYGIAVSPDGSIVYFTDPLANAVKVLSTSTYTVIATIPVPAGPSYILLSSDGSRLYVSDEPSKQVTVINTSTNSIVATIPVGSKPISLGLVPDGTQLYVLNILGSSISVINTATNTVINTIHLHSSPDAWGTFIASPCGIGPITHTITVNPSPFITPSAISGSIAACAGATSASPAIQTFAVSGSYLTGDITATASTGFEVSLDPISGYAHTATIAQSGGAVNAIPIYIRSSAAVQQGNITGSITLSTTGGTDQQVAVAATITAQPTISFPADSVVEGNTGIQLTPSVTGNIATYDWSPTDGLSAADIPNPVANPVDPTTYQLRVTTDNGCAAVGKITVIIHRPLLMASAFTPNGDGHNDLFRIPPGANLVLEQFTVFNRWGFEVFGTNNAAVGWDGTTQGSPAPSGVYVYVIKGKDGTGRSITLKGTVALIR